MNWPFEVVQVVGPVAYKLKMNPGWRFHPVFHVLLLQLYREDGRVQPPPPPVEMEGALEYEVESILEHRFWGIKHQGSKIRDSSIFESRRDSRILTHLSLIAIKYAEKFVAINHSDVIID
jgi:hypothetical protein